MSQEQAKDHGSDASLRSHSQGLCSRCDSDTHQLILMRSRAVRAATSSQPDDACSRVGAGCTQELAGLHRTLVAFLCVAVQTR